MTDAAEHDMSWVAGLDPSGRSVSSFALPGHEAVVRILNPAYKAGEPVTWEELGGARFEPRSDLQWADLGIDRRDQNVLEPEMGGISPSVVSVLLRHLDAANVVTAQWEGYADVEITGSAALVVFPPRRRSLIADMTPGALRHSRRVPLR
jgi:hypothetical protein